MAVSSLMLMFSQRRFYAAYSAAVLVVIQVGIGIILKAAQTDKKYEFSPSSSITISETLKMLLALGLFHREWRSKRTHDAHRAYMPVSESDACIQLSMETEQSTEAEDTIEGGMCDESMLRSQRLAQFSFWTAVRNEVSIDVTFGLALLALFYVLINNLIFVSYQLADPATIQLTRSGVTCITAMILMVTTKVSITSNQWLALVLQVCGLVVTQYDPRAGGAYPSSTYALLMFHVSLSAVAGVLNQVLLQSGNSSLHANNFILYGAGATNNLLCHMLTRFIKPGEPKFFQGYGSVGATLIILNNVLIGLAMNAVYKYANAIIKCIATAFATAILIFLSPLLFGTTFNPLVIPGSIVIFGASWLYVNQSTSGPPETNSNASPASRGSARVSLPALRKLYPVLYGFAQLLTLVVVGFTCISDSKVLSGPSSEVKGEVAPTASPL